MLRRPPANQGSFAHYGYSHLSQCHLKSYPPHFHQPEHPLPPLPPFSHESPITAPPWPHEDSRASGKLEGMRSGWRAGGNSCFEEASQRKNERQVEWQLRFCSRTDEHIKNVVTGEASLNPRRSTQLAAQPFVFS